MKNKELITKLQWLFESQKFSDWYGDDGDMGKFIAGELAYETKMTREECVKKIRSDIARFLQIDDI